MLIRRAVLKAMGLLKPTSMMFKAILLSLFLITSFSQNGFAAGTFITAPNRTDMIYDGIRQILYITSSSSVLRYSLSTNSFLPPFELGGNLIGIDISPDDNTLAVADHNLYGIYLIDLKSGQSKRVIYKPAGDRGSFAVAFASNKTLLITASFDGSGWVPLRKYDITTDTFTTLAAVMQDTMVSASADGSVIGFAESNISDGRFGRYRTADGNMLRKDGYTDGTGWFNYEIGVNRNGTQYAIPTYGGTFLTDSTLTKYAIVGDYAGGQPIGVAYNPVKDIVYFAWATTSQVYAYDSNTLQKVASYDFENNFSSPGNHAFVEGRMKISKDGKYLFVTVKNGVRYIDLNLPGNKLTTEKLLSPDHSVHPIR